MDARNTEKFQFWLGLRPGSAVRFNALFAESRPAASPSAAASGAVVLKGAAEGYFTLKPLRNFVLDADRISIRSFSLRNITAYEKERRRILALLPDPEGRETGFLGESPAVAAVRENARLAAESGATLLIQGETGSGKEVLARFLHAHSPYAKGPFVKVDCASLPESLLESELFGHEKGAFTGATESRQGRFEEAQGGVLFLDEVSNLSGPVQAKLLGFLQDFTLTRVGGTVPVRLTLQIMAASNLPLPELVAQGRFRQDLFYRLNVFSFTLPPLRDRLEDLPALCEYFIRIFSERHGKAVRGLSGPAFRRLFEHAWPGNIRELKNTLQRAVVFCDGPEIREEHLNLAGIAPASAADPGIAARGKNRRGALSSVTPEEVLALAGELKGNVKKIAARLGVSRLSAYKLFSRHGIPVRDFRGQRPPAGGLNLPQ
jgi:DNA-binding NtrC family response regulator